jgi:Protein of unknown function (DUF3592)
VVPRPWAPTMLVASRPRPGATTNGAITVVRPVNGYGHHDSTCTLRYHYEVDGRHYDSGTRSSDTWACSRYEGETVEVRYDPLRPWQGSILEDQTGLWALTIAGTLGPLAFLGAGVGSLIGWIGHTRRVNRESGSGEQLTTAPIEPTGSMSDPVSEPGADGWPLLESPRPEER